ncbi:glycosyltransferase family 2 protein [Tengunoibacter tsumagoiensis]|uniref:Glycosyltransferase 2-like domain-containing protein n=1 Tax=Tengunoibacter tsumagoiensis TaxID=2014871 RepID=A0A402A151_9CHLR|nr:glycosyltransferase family 2 protein [Tengunoibacter tsumagoiensis]GCE12853.1 hypothetical protein KTT_27120 [Tengunoibacter tsumagoiensis]
MPQVPLNNSIAIDNADKLLPLQVLEIELSQPLPFIAAFHSEKQQHYTKALCLIKFHTFPLGVVELRLNGDGLPPQTYGPIIWQKLKRSILDHLQADGLPPIDALPEQGVLHPDHPACLKVREQFLAQAPFASIIISTRDRPLELRNCLQALLKLEYLDYEIIIVDNAPTSHATAEMIQASFPNEQKIRYIREDHPGISCARNRGIIEARSEFLAFTDDDVIVDRHWLTQLVSALSQSNDIVCATGFTMPLELDTPAQLWFENASWIATDEEARSRFQPRIIDKKLRYQQIYSGNMCGHGANMAARASFLQQIGGFAMFLGTGTPTMGAEDIAFFLDVTAHNKQLAIDPGAIIYHLHRREMAKLRYQIFGYGVGFTAYLVHIFLRYPKLFLALFTTVPLAILKRLFVKTAPKVTHNTFLDRQQDHDYPQELIRIQMKGYLYGPFLYGKSWWMTRKLRREMNALWKQGIAQKRVTHQKS